MDEINKLAEVFNPIYFDSDYICKLAKECGMKYIVITAKPIKVLLFLIQKSAILTSTPTIKET